MGKSVKPVFYLGKPAGWEILGIPTATYDDIDDDTTMDRAPTHDDTDDGGDGYPVWRSSQGADETSQIAPVPFKIASRGVFIRT